MRAARGTFAFFRPAVAAAVFFPMRFAFAMRVVVFAVVRPTAFPLPRLEPSDDFAFTVF